MRAGTLESVLRHDRVVVIVALAALTLLAWAYLAWLAQGMDAGLPWPTPPTGAAPPGAPTDAMAGMEHTSPGSPAMGPVTVPWDTVGFALSFAMWTVMMVGMMLPSAAPMLLLHARVARQCAGGARPLAATGVFAAGYLLAWSAFALAASIGQWLLQRALLLDPMLASASTVFSGLVLIAAGAYQWTPLKRACLHQCQAPWVFLHRHGGLRADARGAIALGLRHGLYCVGCCWALMALLFVGGVMNLLWIAAIAAFVLVEKLAPHLRWISRLAGSAMVIGGLWLMADLH
jgi:predicted metal-binding membrane protein